MRTLALFIFLVATWVPTPVAKVGVDLPAFPGAEGFGAKASGGRGGSVQLVTTLAPTGAGSLQAALDQPGPRIIVFRVSGLIEGDIVIPHGNVTIAGQTAPGAGITILGHLTTPFGEPISNMILRHIHEWPPSQHDAIQFSTANTYILDHIDASHAADETIDAWDGAYDITLQWSAITYPIYDEANGWTHNKGFLNHRSCIDDDDCSGEPLGGRVSIHHNFFAHNRNRTPALSTGPADIINNVTYNGREGFVHHNIAGGAGADLAEVGDFNLVGNWYVAGPSASLLPFYFDPENGTPPPIPTRYYLFDNWVEDIGVFVGRVDNPFDDPDFLDAYSPSCCGIEASQFNKFGWFDFSEYSGYVPITTFDGDGAMDRVLATVGAWPRDIVNRWAVQDLESRGGAWGNRRPENWLDGLTPGTPPVDADRDGMADDWELNHELSPSNPNDHTTIMPSGYTAIEEYINQLADALVNPPIFADGFESGFVTTPSK